MAINFCCDRCGFKTTEPGTVNRYTVEINGESPVESCTVDLCDKCIETAWKRINELLFRSEKQLQ